MEWIRSYGVDKVSSLFYRKRKRESGAVGFRSKINMGKVGIQ